MPTSTHITRKTAMGEGGPADEAGAGVRAETAAAEAASASVGGPQGT